LVFDDPFPEAPDVRKGMRGLLPEVNGRTSEVLYLPAEGDDLLGEEADFRAESADFEAEEEDLLGEQAGRRAEGGDLLEEVERPPGGGGVTSGRRWSDLRAEVERPPPRAPLTVGYRL